MVGCSRDFQLGPAGETLVKTVGAQHAAPLLSAEPTSYRFNNALTPSRTPQLPL